MKLMSFEGVFILPDDFQGSYYEALTEMLKYHLSKYAKENHHVDEGKSPQYPTFDWNSQ